MGPVAGSAFARFFRVELAQIAAPGAAAWRRDAQAITVFKSVGFAALDLIAAEQVWRAQQ